ncbi:MAG: STAS domain-containing protein [Nitrospirota bacterium]
MPVNINIADYKGKKVLVVSGDIDMYSSPVLREELMILVRNRIPVLFVDFKGVSYIDSSGIATFVEGLKAMKSYGGRLRFVGIPEGIMEIFSFSKLDKVFEIYRDIDEASA